ncbi:MAG: adenylyl-sulfate kinase [Planctomycetes bacterium]|nr:adenylyl-sulfate kinase [Planctomycetota bacterium]
MDKPKSQHITKFETKVNRVEREALNGHKGVTVWFTGLSASGKSTIAVLVDQMLAARGARSYVLDGDNIRHGLNRDLGFSPADRAENIRRIGEVARLFTQAGIINLTAFISPYREDRDRNRSIQDPGDFVEVFVDSPLEVCERRDPRGLYRLAREGKIPEFTGISAPYEPPLHPDLVLYTDRESEEESAATLVAYLEEHGYLWGGAARGKERAAAGKRASGR